MLAHTVSWIACTCLCDVHASAKEVFAKLRNNSITVPGEEVHALSEAARDLKIAIVIGANERAGPANGTLYNSLLTISEDGLLSNHHRKLVRLLDV